MTIVSVTLYFSLVLFFLFHCYSFSFYVGYGSWVFGVRVLSWWRLGAVVRALWVLWRRGSLNVYDNPGNKYGALIILQPELSLHLLDFGCLTDTMKEKICQVCRH